MPRFIDKLQLIDPAAYLRRRRAGFYARGLTHTGRPRRNQRHPMLAGLPRKEYRRRYMAITRAQARSQQSTIHQSNS